MILRTEPLTKDAFAAFGEVIDIPGVAPVSINQGFAKRFDGLATVDVSSSDGQVNVSIFHVLARPAPIELTVMERRPLGSQFLVPMQDRPWLIAVCADPSDLSSYRAFAATGSQGVSYRRNVWHHPVLTIDSFSRFLVVDRVGPGNNLEERPIPRSAALVLTNGDVKAASPASWPTT